MTTTGVTVLSLEETLAYVERSRAYQRTLWDREGEVLRRFHQLFHASPYTWAVATWRGRVLQKAPTDMVVLQELIYATQPDLIIETGTCDGGGALFYADMLRLMTERGGRVITVDSAAPRPMTPDPLVSYLCGSSTDPDVVARVREEAATAQRVMVVLDSDHRADHVLRELNLYAPLVSPGQWMIVEDTNLNHEVPLSTDGIAWRGTAEDVAHDRDLQQSGQFLAAGPREALSVWLPQHPEFRPEPYCERYLLTFNPGGYLQRLS